ncbi:hypothetical protein NKY41_25365, partial [Sinorhizobium meliloti]
IGTLGERRTYAPLAIVLFTALTLPDRYAWDVSRRLGSESQMALVPLGGGAADGLCPYVLNQHEAIHLNVADLSVSFRGRGFAISNITKH